FHRSGPFIAPSEVRETMVGRKRDNKKQPNGAGSISQRADGRWMGRLTLENGKRKYFYGKSWDDVHGELIKALADQRQGLPVATGRQTVGQYLAHWLEHATRPKVRPKTYHSYAQLVRLHLIPGLGKRPLAKLNPQHVQQFLNEKQAAGLSPRTVQYLR